MANKHKLEMPDYSVTIAIDDEDNVGLDVAAHPDIAEDLGNAILKLLETQEGAPIVAACRNPADQRLQEAAKSLLNKRIRVVQPGEGEETGEQEDQME
jgi:hypothetical protein